MGDHALSFRVLRLRPPALDIPDQNRFNFKEDVAPGANFSEQDLGNGATPFADRAELRSDSQLGVSGSLVLPQTFGTVYLGQTLTLAVALTNISSAPVSNVGIRVEIQSDHGKSVLYDTMPTRGLATLAPGQHYEIMVKHDVRDLGPHTLLCASAYTTLAASTEARYSPQTFKFQAQNPLVVRTKHRSVGSSTVFLEATIENKTQDTMFIESVELAAAAGYSARSIASPSTSHLSDINYSNSAAGTHASPPAAVQDVGPLASYIASVPLLHPGGGAAGYIFRLDRLWHGARPVGYLEGPGNTTPGISPRTASPADDGTALGKLDIRWRGPMGDPARLQTQVISGPPRPQRELRLELTHLPGKIAVAEPCVIDVTIVSAVDRRMGPLKVSYHPPSMVAPLGGGPGGAGIEGGIVMEGLQSVCIEEMAPRGKVSVPLTLFPRGSGRQFVQGIMLTDERDGRVFDTLASFEVTVAEFNTN